MRVPEHAQRRKAQQPTTIPEKITRSPSGPHQDSRTPGDTSLTRVCEFTDRPLAECWVFRVVSVLHAGAHDEPPRHEI